ncbi:hypothetical protein L195_g023473 [Trifolium pratense]|uniref:Uncharacterized protein n=1 Tax=Trifolium pratense TaxID=57577 RepID=A0A2K3NAY5_TRIPR|nr:hypothetical protein L195_g023473 [Trifolium pratense]
MKPLEVSRGRKRPEQKYWRVLPVLRVGQISHCFYEKQMEGSYILNFRLFPEWIYYVCEDYSGNISFSASRKENLTVDPKLAEALAIRWCLQLEKDQNLKYTIKHENEGRAIFDIC